MNVEVPNIPSELNPKWLPVETSSIGELKEGWWDFRLSGGKWIIASPKYEDQVDQICARLMDREYMFNDQLTPTDVIESTISSQYELVDHDNFYSRCDDCPFVSARDNECHVRYSRFYCGTNKKWQKIKKVSADNANEERQLFCNEVWNNIDKMHEILTDLCADLHKLFPDYEKVIARAKVEGLLPYT
jgi:hypothetical protein